MKRMMIAAVVAAGLATAGLVVGCESMKKDRDDHAGHAGHGGHAEHAEHDGTTEVAVSMTEVPRPVSNAFTKNHPGARAVSVKKETYADGLVHYEFEWTDNDGTKREAEYSAEGEELDEH